MKEFNYNGRVIKYRETGSGDDLIMIHNGGAFHGIWTHQISELESSYKIYAFDLMNFGESDYRFDTSSIEDQYNMLQEFIKNKNIQNPILMGSCIGASLALYFSKLNPNKIKSLILFNICPGIELMRTPFAKYWYALTKKFNLIKKFSNFCLLKVMNSNFEYNRLPGLLFGKDVDEQDPIFLQLQKYYRTDKQKKARLELLNSIDSYTVQHFIKANDCHVLPPSLIFWGEYNKIVPLEIGLQLKTLLRPKHFISIRDCGHLLMLEKSSYVNKKIISFLDENN